MFILMCKLCNYRASCYSYCCYFSQVYSQPDLSLVKAYLGLGLAIIVIHCILLLPIFDQPDLCQVQRSCESPRASPTVLICACLSSDTYYTTVQTWLVVDDQQGLGLVTKLSLSFSLSKHVCSTHGRLEQLNVNHTSLFTCSLQNIRISFPSPDPQMTWFDDVIFI